MTSRIILSTIAAAIFCMTAHAKEIKTVEGYDLVTHRSLTLDLEKQKTVLLFISPVCPCSQSHEKVIRHLKKKFPDVSFIGVHSNANEPKELSQKYFKDRFSFPVIHDPKSELADLLGAFKTPHAFIVDRGKVVFSGGVDNSHVAEKATQPYLKTALNQISHGQTPNPSQVRSLGCVIQRP